MSQQLETAPCPDQMRAYCQTLAIDITGKEQAEIEAIYWRTKYTRLAEAVKQDDCAAENRNHTLENTAPTTDAEEYLAPDLIASWTQDRIC